MWAAACPAHQHLVGHIITEDYSSSVSTPSIVKDYDIFPTFFLSADLMCSLQASQACLFTKMHCKCYRIVRNLGKKAYLCRSPSLV